MHSGDVMHSDITNSKNKYLPHSFNEQSFVLLKAGQKYPPIEKGWKDKPHGLNKAQRWIKQGNNIGILVKYPYAVLDLDNPQAVSGLSLPVTTAWETRPGRYAYLIRWSEKPDEISNILKKLRKNPDVAQLRLFMDGEHVGELKLQRTYQVIPPSWKQIDGTRIEYKMIKDDPPATVSFRWLIDELQRLGVTFSETNTAKERLDANIERLESMQQEILLRAGSLQKYAEDCLKTAISKGTDGCRNNVGFELARMLRNLGLDAATASEYLLRYQQAVRDRGDHEYTRDEALRSLESAYQNDQKPRKIAMKDLLLEKILKTVELWHDEVSTGYVTISQNGIHASYPVKSTPVRQWIARLFYEDFKKTPRKEDISAIVDTMESIAVSRELHKTYLRIAEVNNKIYIDMGRADWKILEIDSSGWRMIDRAPIKFIRYGRMCPIPEPRRGGSWQHVIELLRLPDHESAVLILGWMLQAVWPHGPYAHLVLDGEQGSGKSTLAMILKKITDPSDFLLRRPPRDEEDLFVAARKERILSFDNLSGIHDWLSDALCCFSTGAAYSKRQKYSDWEEAAITVRRPCILNGIEALPHRPDLLDRTIIISLRPLAVEHRVEEDMLIASVDEYLAEIWGLLADAASAGLRNRDRTRDELRGKLPRMADFAMWVSACEEAMPWEKGEFLRIYNDNKRAGSDTLLEGDLLAMAVLELARQEAIRERCFEGTPSLLYNELMTVANINVSHPPKGWPAGVNWMMQRLKRLAPALREHGVEVDMSTRTRHGRVVKIWLRTIEEVKNNIDSGRSGDDSDGIKKISSHNNQHAATSCDDMTVVTIFSLESTSKEEEHRESKDAVREEWESAGKISSQPSLPSPSGDACRFCGDDILDIPSHTEKYRHRVDELEQKIIEDLKRGSKLKDLFTISINICEKPYDVLHALERLEKRGAVVKLHATIGTDRWRLAQDD